MRDAWQGREIMYRWQLTLPWVYMTIMFVIESHLFRTTGSGTTGFEDSAGK